MKALIAGLNTADDKPFPASGHTRLSFVISHCEACNCTANFATAALRPKLAAEPLLRIIVNFVILYSEVLNARQCQAL